MNKRQVMWSGFIFLACLVIGGRMIYMSNRENHELLEIEKQSVVALKKTFADISEVKVEKSVYDKQTGTYGIYVRMTNIQNKTLKFMYNFEKQGDSVYGFVLEDKDIQKRGMTKNKINVIFSNGVEEMI